MICTHPEVASGFRSQTCMAAGEQAVSMCCSELMASLMLDFSNRPPTSKSLIPFHSPLRSYAWFFTVKLATLSHQEISPEDSFMGQWYKMHHSALIFTMQCLSILELSLKAPYNILPYRKNKQQKFFVSFTFFIVVLIRKQSYYLLLLFLGTFFIDAGKMLFLKKISLAKIFLDFNFT